MNLGKESETLEFKKTTGELKEAMISISSILNKHGVGTLYFGVKPNGDVVGQDVSESSLRDVSRFVYEFIKPQIYPMIQEVVLEDRHVIKVEFHGEDYVTVNISLNKNEQAVHCLLEKNPYYTRQELADATSKSLRTIQWTLDSLRKKELIERIGSDKSGFWEVKS